MSSSLRYVLAAPLAASVDSMDRVRARSSELARAYPDTIDRAIAGGFDADRLGYAFACGYVAALAALAPDLARGRLFALCATEEGGAHPRAIATRLDGDTVDGRKLFATLATHVDALLVVATTGADAEGRNRLRVAIVDARAPGVTMTRLPQTPFAPEIPHAEVRFAAAKVERVLDGDGYDRYLKPFRTIEDVHVLGATLGYLTRVARASGWPREVVIEMTALLAAARAIAADDPSDPATHVALAGLFAQSRALVARLEPHWSSVAPEVRDRWARDRELLEVAGRARAQRLESAFRVLAGA